MNWISGTRRLATWAVVSMAAGLAFSPSPASAAAYETPQVFRLEATVPLGPDMHNVCLVRAVEPWPPPSPVPVSTRAVCYTSYEPAPAPPPPPPPLQALIPWSYHQLTQGERSGGQLTLHAQPCIGLPDVFALKVDLVVPLSKTGGAVSGNYVILTSDSAAPFDCADGTVTTGPLTLTPLAPNHNEDSAESLAVLGLPDGCTDEQELGASAGSGGLRDPFNAYDFFDTDGNRAIASSDIFAVAAKFGSQAPGPPYAPSHDRGGVVAGVGPSIWNQEPPDGSIATPDIFAVSGQFGHSCL